MVLYARGPELLQPGRQGSRGSGWTTKTSHCITRLHNYTHTATPATTPTATPITTPTAIPTPTLTFTPKPHSHPHPNPHQQPPTLHGSWLQILQLGMLNIMGFYVICFFIVQTSLQPHIFHSGNRAYFSFPYIDSLIQKFNLSIFLFNIFYVFLFFSFQFLFQIVKIFIKIPYFFPHI